MSLSDPFIHRPIGTSLLMVAILLSGLLAYFLLPISSLPEVDYPTMQVVTFYPGASPAVMASSITAPLERQFGQMPGLDEMTSSSSSGASVITLQFTLNMSLDVAEQEVQAAINASANYLPADLPVPPIYSKVNPADTPIITLSLSSSKFPLRTVEDFADTRLAQKIAEQPGVGLVSISGGERPAVRVQANPVALAAYGLTLEGIRNAIITANVNAAKGNFNGPHIAYTINANDQLLSSEAYRPLIIAYRNNAPVRLQDVAHIEDSVENIHQAAWMNKLPAVILNVRRQPGANVIQVADSIKILLSKLKPTIPNAINIALLTDRTLTIRASIAQVQFDLLFSIALVVMVIFIFLRNFSATLIPSIAVPIALIGTLGVMYLFGFSLNNLTLMALTIATGFIADDAIVMIENIARYIEQGEPPYLAAQKGAAQISFTIISLTVSLIAVLIPLLFMRDIIGRLFREFALTLSVTILLSAFVSLTLTPMLCARMLHKLTQREMNRFQQKAAIYQQFIIDKYDASLRIVLNHQSLILVIAILTLTLSCFLFYFIPKDFFPIQDTGLIQGISEAPPTISYKGMAERQQALADVILKDQAVLNLSSFIGIDGTNLTQNSGRFLITLKPIAERDASATEIIQRLQTQLKPVSGMKLYLQPVQDLTVDTRISRNQYQYSVSAFDAAELTYWSQQLLNQLHKIKQIEDVASDEQNQGLAASITIDRDTAARLGITTQMIDDTLYDAFGQRQISTMFTERNQYRVILEILPQWQQDLLSLKNIYLNAPSVNAFTKNAITAESTGASATFSPGSSTYSPLTSSGLPVNANITANALSSLPIPTGVTGKLGAIPLTTFTHTATQLAPLIINRQGQFPVTTLSFNLATHVALGEAIKAIKQAESVLNLPQSIQTEFKGAASIFQNALANEGWLLLAAIVVVYLMLGVLYESYIHPITILSTLPSAGVGALLALELFGQSLTVIALIGIILLIGIVMKNAIMMIDFALEQERRYHKTPLDAIYQAALLRFRPILMTTLAALFGAVPLAIGSGMGAELRRPLGIAIIGGLIVSQLLTLYTTPIIYLAFDKLARNVVARYGKPYIPSLDEK